MKSSQIVVGMDYAWKVPDPYTRGQYDTYRVRVVGLGKPREVEVTKTYETTWGRKRTEKTGEVRTSKRADGVTIVKCNIDGTVKMKDSVRPDMLVVPARQIWKPWKEYYRRQLKGAVNCLAARCSENRHKHAISEVARILSEIGIPVVVASGAIYPTEETVQWHAEYSNARFQQDAGLKEDWRWQQLVNDWQQKSRNYNYQATGEVKE